ncbi:hypothetical protein BDZ89DRAFT_664621 [Hymenopellis radicata]|nr:hypothetical protein BDZ89DRAFT_664621 [Hymenopellis radicata]
MTTTSVSDQAPNLPLTIESFFQYTSLGRAFTIPTAVDIEALATRIAVDEYNVDQILDPEIRRLSSLLSALQEHRSHAANAIQKNRVYILPSPIRKLPPEIILTIFRYACDTSRIRDTFGENTFLTPLRISLVCARWRDLCLVTPMLWSCIYVGPKDVFRPQPDRPLVPLYLDRSREAALCIKLEHCAIASHICTAKDTVVALLFDNCRRWKSLFCKLAFPRLLQSLRSF